MKTCSRCNKSKGVSEFNRHLAAKDGLSSRCRECCSEHWAMNGERYRHDKNLRQRESYRLNPEKHKSRTRKSVYGISEDQYRQLVCDQAGRCAICNRVTQLCVDHDHKSGRVRGLLCRVCNTYLGMVEESEAPFYRAIQYLKG